MKSWIKILLSLILCVVIGGIGYISYSKYMEYKFNEELKKVIEVEDKLESDQVISKYNELIKNYKKNDKAYLALSNFYFKNNRLTESVQAIYDGEAKSKDKELFKKAMEQRLNGIKLEKGYIKVIKGSKDRLKEETTLTTEDDQVVALRVECDEKGLERDKEGWYDLSFKEKLTGKQVAIDVEVGEDLGNTMGNNFYGGNMAYKNGYIYFVSPNGNSIYKMKEDLSEKTEIIKDVKASFINIKDNNLYFIDYNEGQYGGLIKTDLNGSNKTVVKQSCDYVYIIGDNIFYSVVEGQHNGWQTVHLSSMDFNGKDIKPQIDIASGMIKSLNSKYSYNVNRYGGFIKGEKEAYIWGDAREYKYLSSIDEYKGKFYGVVEDSRMEPGLCTIDIEHNSQQAIKTGVEYSVVINGKIYYIKDNQVYVGTIDKNDDKKLIDYKYDGYSQMYNINGRVFLYSKNDIVTIKGKSILTASKDSKAENKSILQGDKSKDDKSKTDVTSDIKNEEILDMANKANGLFLTLLANRESTEVNMNGTVYLKMKSPYDKMDNIRKEYSKYYTKEYTENNMKIFKEANGAVYMVAGDIGAIGGYKYDSVKTRSNKGDKIEIEAYAKDTYDPSNFQQDGKITMKLENGKWKIEKFFNVFGL